MRKSPIKFATPAGVSRNVWPSDGGYHNDVVIDITNVIDMKLAADASKYKKSVNWKNRRRQLLEDGVCVVEGALTQAMLERLRAMAHATLAGLSPEHRRDQRSTGSMVANRHLPELADLIAWPATLRALERLGYSDVRSSRAYLISKPPHSPPLFWHQDFTVWSGEPRAYSNCSPQLFAMFYLVDTTPSNGCLRFLPGSHRRRHPLHDAVGVAHTAETRRMDDPTSALYAKADGEVDLPVHAGDVVVGDGRALHATHANHTDQERSVITIWYHPMFSQLQEGTRAQIAGLAQTEIEHWPAAARRKLAPLVAQYHGAANPTPRNRVPGPTLR